jgi:TonB dependent receptor/Carboxypeptidase regulatory-like domain/TonB-dependent Receptor Plug Domain
MRFPSTCLSLQNLLCTRACAGVRLRRACLTSSVLLLCAAVAAAQGQTGIVQGTVRDDNGQPIQGARITIDGVAGGTTSRLDGAWALTGIPVGAQTLRIVRLGHVPFVDTVVVGATPLQRDVTLAVRPLALSQVVIAPGVYGGLSADVPSLQVMTREDLLVRPQLVEDLFRSLNRLPGLSGSDFSAKLRIRNSAADDVLYTLDGLELIEPYHMKDFDGALSIVDQDAIGRIEISSGGFGAAFGNRAAGVVQMSTAMPDGSSGGTALGLSLSNVRARSAGRFHDGQGAWMLAARRGYLDLVFKLIGEEDAPNPRYYDVTGRVQRLLGRRHLAAANILVANDAMTYSEDGGVTNAIGKYGNAYLWTTLQSQWSDELRGTTVASFSDLAWRRNGQEAEYFGSRILPRAGFRDRRGLDVLGLRQDWSWDVTPRASLLFGGELRREEAAYDYRRFHVDRIPVGSQVIVRDSIEWRIGRSERGTRRSLYLAGRLSPVRQVMVEGGGRADRHGWTGQTTLVPRVNARWDMAPRTTLRAAWGDYAQAQGLQDLSVVDGDSTFARAEQTEQRVVGVEHRAPGWTMRVEAFDRRIREPRPRWYSADGGLDPFPEGQDDRVQLLSDSARVRGVEVSGGWEVSSRVRASAWYARTHGRTFRGGRGSVRPFEEPHAGAVDLIARSSAGWTWGVSWTFRSGWPAMLAEFVVDTLAPGRYDISRRTPGGDFTERLGGYRRLDVRLSRQWRAHRGVVSAFAEVFNLLDRANQRGWDYNLRMTNGNLQVTSFPEAFVGRLPTVGVRWEF